MESSSVSVPHFNLKLNGEDINDCKRQVSEIVCELFPNWQALNFERFTEGLSNTILSVWSDVEPTCRLIFRIYGEGTELLIDRNKELSNLLYLNKVGFVRPVYATYENGFTHEYVPGVALNATDLYDLNISRLIAEKLAVLHSSSIAGNKSPVLFKLLKTFISLVASTTFEKPDTQQRYEKEYPSIDVLLQEMAFMENELLPLNDEIVPCHNDLLPKNIIYDAEKGSIDFIDYEYFGYSFRAFDIGNHFCEFAGADENRNYDRYPGRDFQLKWLKEYLNCFNARTGRCDCTEKELNYLYVVVNKFSKASHFMWSLWAIILAKDCKIPFDYLQYGIERMNQYFVLKERFSQLTFSLDGSVVEN